MNYRSVWSNRVCLGLLLLAGVTSAMAASITNVTIVNVTPSSFSALWGGGDLGASLSVYADSQGATNLAGKVGIEVLPLHTGGSALAAGYERRQNWAAIRQKTRANGLMQVRVTGCQPGSTYYYRISSSASSYPATGPLPAVTMPLENSFLTQSRQLVIEVPGVDTQGRIVTLTHTNAAYALAAVVGDGAGDQQAWFNLGELMALAGNGNFMPLGSQQFTTSLLGPAGQPELAQTFDIQFTADFLVSQGNSGSFGIEYLALSLGNAFVRTGEFATVPLGLNCNVGVSEINANVGVATDRLTEFSFLNLPSSVQAATLTPQSPTNALLVMRAHAGQFIQGQITLANLRFRAVSNQSSAFVPLQWRSLSALKNPTSPVSNLAAEGGRVVVIGREPLVETQGTVDGFHGVTVYGKPWSGYAIEYATKLGPSADWRLFSRIPLTNFFHHFTGLSSDRSPIFYRAMELPGDPPAIETLPGTAQARSLLVYGSPAGQYTVQYATNLSGAVAWRPLTTYTLTNSFRYLDPLPATNSIIFLRLQRN